MESLSIDPRIPPNFPMEERNLSDGGRISVNHKNTAQHEPRKEDIEKKKTFLPRIVNKVK